MVWDKRRMEKGRGRNNLVPSSHTPPGEKRSGEQSRISWAYSPKVVGTNEIVALPLQ